MVFVMIRWRNYHYMTNDIMILLRGIFSIFSVWHRLTTLFDAEDDPRVPAFQVSVIIIIIIVVIIVVLIIILIAIIDIRMAAYILTILSSSSNSPRRTSTWQRTSLQSSGESSDLQSASSTARRYAGPLGLDEVCVGKVPKIYQHQFH